MRDADRWLARARERLVMATRLRGAAEKLNATAARAKLTQLAALYEQLSLCYLEESCVVPADGNGKRRQAFAQTSSVESAPTAYGWESGLLTGRDTQVSFPRH